MKHHVNLHKTRACMNSCNYFGCRLYYSIDGWHLAGNTLIDITRLFEPTLSLRLSACKTVK
jgi:hypothetical protein